MSNSKLEWLVNVDVNTLPDRNFRRSSIIGTIGPKTNSVEKLIELRKAGLNIARMNFSHGSHEYHQSVIDNARESEKIYPGRPLALALDTKGPEIRTGNTRDDKDWPIPAEHEMIFTTDEQYKDVSDDTIMFIDYKNITKVIAPGKFIFVDDGVLSFTVIEIVSDKTIKVKSVNAGRISSHKGVNLPDTNVDLPALSEKDVSDLEFGVKNGVHMVFASFIRSADDVRHIRRVLGEKGKNIQIIVKIENRQGVNNFDEILKETDGVMVARGDLGIEIPAPQVFIVQKQLIAKCNLAGKPVICATQMLESMTYNPRPTRAEVSDVGNAIVDGADCVMLSGETAKGNYPDEAVSMMHHTVIVAEMTLPYFSQFGEIRDATKKPCDIQETIAMSAVTATFEQNAKAIIVLSTSGTTARLCAKYRPNCPIIMVTRSDDASRFCHLYRGVYPFLFTQPAEAEENWLEDVENRVDLAIEEALKLNILNKGDTVVIVQGHQRGAGHSNTLRLVQI